MAELSPNEIQEEEARNEALLELVNERQFRTLRQELSEMNEVDVAAFIEELDPEKTVVVFRMLPKELASDVLPVWNWTNSSTLSAALPIRS